MNVDHAARVLAYQRKLARIQRHLIRYSHPAEVAPTLPASVRISQRPPDTRPSQAWPPPDRDR